TIVFFFQAEDGIRDRNVTGVQTCALPIFLASSIVQYIHGGATFDATKFDKGLVEVGTLVARNKETGKYEPFSVVEGYDNFFVLRSEERRVGKECGFKRSPRHRI